MIIEGGVNRESYIVSQSRIEWNLIKKNSMEGFMINGYVNGDKNLDFRIAFEKYSGKLSVDFIKVVLKLGRILINIRRILCKYSCIE